MRLHHWHSILANNLLSDYTDFELISAISTMESFQKIYRPEIYNTNATAGLVYQPSLNFRRLFINPYCV